MVQVVRVANHLLYKDFSTFFRTVSVTALERRYGTCPLIIVLFLKKPAKITVINWFLRFFSKKCRYRDGTHIENKR